MDSKMYEKAVIATRNKVKIHNLINFDIEPIEPVKVSIVIPVCNVETYLRECLDSAVNQTLKEIEIICVNDGSTDGSLAILMEYAAKDSRVKIIDKDNAGYGHAMNIGMDMASGQYIGILESDDFADLHMYGDLYAIAKVNQVDFIKADFNRFVVENGKFKNTYNAVAARARDLYNKPVNPREDKRVFALVMQTWSGIYCRSYLVENGIRHNESPGASYQDNGFWFQSLIFAKSVMFYDRPYYMNRRDNPNSSVHNKSKVYCMNQEYEYIRGILENNPDLYREFFFQYSYKKFINYIFTYNRIGDEFKWEYLHNFHTELVRADQASEIQWELYDKADFDNLQMVLTAPGDFYLKSRAAGLVQEGTKKLRVENNRLKEENMRLRRQRMAREAECAEKQRYIYRLWNSTSHQVGRAITVLPRRLKDHKILREKEANDRSNNIVHLACITDDNYAMPTAVALTSAKLNKWEKSIYKVHILASNISEDSRRRLKQLNSEDFAINIIDVQEDKRFQGITKRDGDLHVSTAAIVKFQLPQILNKVGKVLYIDGDVLVQRDLRELYNTSIIGKYAGVVKDIISERNPKHMHFLKCKNRYYFNSGMMLLNLSKLRKDKISDKLVDYRLHGINHFMDQDALNVVFKENVLYVSPQYNFLNKFYDWWDGERLSVFYGENIPMKAKQAYKNAAILHLGSHEKPWIYNMGYLSKLYKRYYKKSPYRDCPLSLKKLEQD